MNIVLNSINAVLPLGIMGFIGFILTKKSLLSKNTIKECNKLIFNVLLPASLFSSVYSAGEATGIRLKFIAIIIFLEVGIIISAITISCVVSKEIPQRGVMYQAMFRSNMILFGTAIAGSLLSPEEAGVYSVAMIIILPLQNIGTILGMEIFGNMKDGKFNVFEVILGVFKSPLVLAIIMGFILAKLSVPLPIFISSAIKTLGSAATGLCMVLLGGSLSLEGNTGRKGLITIAVLVKIVFMPLLAIPIIYFLKLTFVEAFVILLLCAAPTAVNSYTVTVEMGWDVYLVNRVLIITTVLSIITLTLWLYILQLMY